MLNLENLKIQRQDKVIFENLTLNIQAGECWVVLGKNGVGKTSLLKAMAGLLPIASGKISLNQRSIYSMNPLERARQIGLVLQENQCEFPVSVREYVAHGLFPRCSSLQNCDDNVVKEVLEKTQLNTLADRAVNTLSGGELKRAALATILVQSPLFTLLDEPMNSLDLQYQTFMLDLFVNEVKSNERGLILSLHDINTASKYADKVIFMWGEGRVSFGSAEELITAPQLSELYGVRLTQYNIDGVKLFHVV